MIDRLEREAAGLLVLVEVSGVDGVEGPDEAEDPQEDPAQQVVAEPKAQPGALGGHPLVHERQRGPRRRGHRACGGEQRRARALGADGGRVLGVSLGVAAPHPLAPRPQLRQPCGQRARRELTCTDRMQRGTRQNKRAVYMYWQRRRRTYSYLERWAWRSRRGQRRWSPRRR